MSSVRASAPGKIVFCGEYVVLDGAPAVGLAVNSRSLASLASSNDDVGTVLCPGYREQALRFRRSDDRAEWLDGASLPLLDAALARLELRGAFNARLDTSAFRSGEGKGKFGLGSSASLAVSLVAALARYAGHEDADIATVQDVHRRFQDGRGSGLDVATSFTGGLVEFVIGGTPRRLSLPAGLRLGVFWSGVPSSTTEKIGRYLATGQRDAGRRALAAASAAVIGALGSAEDTVQALEAYSRSLWEFDARRGLGIYGAGHDAVHAAASDLAVAYKPCGAGGGDIGLAVSVDGDALAAFSRRAAGLGYTRLDVDIDNQGLVIEEWTP